MQDKLFHVTIHHHLDGMEATRTFYVRATEADVADEEACAETLAKITRHTGLEQQDIDAVILVAVPVALPPVSVCNLEA